MSIRLIQHGVWLDHGKGDVHIYCDPHTQSIVVGKNEAPSSQKFTPRALILKDRSAVFQSKGANGDCIHTTLDSDLVAQKLAEFLESLEKEFVKG